MLYFIRHGETDFNNQGLWMGCTDIELNPKGQQQALQAGEALSSTTIDIIYTSPLKRAYLTAQLIASKQKNLPSIVILDELRERGFGVLEGTPRNQPLDDDFDTITGVEPKKLLIIRLNKALSLAMPKDNQNVLMVSHGAVFHCLSNDMQYNYKPKQNTQQLENCTTVEIFK